nr:MAG TPA: hypothetical protein [Caudoviricetes sp.]
MEAHELKSAHKGGRIITVVYCLVYHGVQFALSSYESFWDSRPLTNGIIPLLDIFVKQV